jgi:hypothetical protein
MERRTKFFWTLIIFISVLAFLWQVFILKGIRETRFDLVESSKDVSIGADKELEEVINSLEAKLRDQSDFEFKLKNNPMKLNKVIFLTDDMGRLIQSMQANTIRVSGLYMNFSPPRATLEFQGKEHQVKVGDKVGDHKIIRISEDGVVVWKDGKAKFHPLQGRTVNPEQARTMTRESEFEEEGY